MPERLRVSVSTLPLPLMRFPLAHALRVVETIKIAVNKRGRMEVMALGFRRCLNIEMYDCTRRFSSVVPGENFVFPDRVLDTGAFAISYFREALRNTIPWLTVCLNL